MLSISIFSGSIESTIFNTGTESVYVPCRIRDDGEGNLNVWQVETKDLPFINNIGTINYETGETKLNFTVYKLPETNDVKFYAETVDEDISPKHHQIILKDSNVSNDTWAIRPGTEISTVNITKYQK